MVMDATDDALQHVSDDGQELVSLVGPFWSAAQVQEALDPSASEASTVLVPLLVLETSDGSTVYPVSQFERRGGRVEVKAGLVPLLARLSPFDAWAVAVLINTPAPELGERTPLQWLKEGLPARDLDDLGAQVAREWSAGSAPQEALITKRRGDR